MTPRKGVAMWFDDRSTDKLGVCYGGSQDRYTNEDIAEIFSRLIIDNLIAGVLHPDIAAQWGTKCGHYGNLALDERAYDDAYAANEQHQRELQCDTPLLMQNLLNSARLAFSVPEPKRK